VGAWYSFQASNLFSWTETRFFVAELPFNFISLLLIFTVQTSARCLGSDVRWVAPVCSHFWILKANPSHMWPQLYLPL
jgi:hypothetical protein